MFSTTRCFDSTSHAATTTAPAAPDGSTHSAIAVDVDPRRFEDPRGQSHEHAAPERDQHVVDEPFAREADEVHAPLVRSDRATHVRVGDHEPQHDGQMERDEDLGVRVRIVRIEVDHERGEHERHRRQHPLPNVELPSAGEVRGEERQHEQAEVPREPGGFLVVREARGESRNLDRDGRARSKDEGLEPATRRALRLVVACQHELLPQSVAVLACELSGQAVDVAHPFHGDQESLIGCEAGRVQLGDLVTEMILELIDVVAVDRRGVYDVSPPLCDL